MRKQLQLLILFVTMLCHQPAKADNHYLSLIETLNATPQMTRPLNEIRTMLHKEIGILRMRLINKTITTLKCAEKNNVIHNNILTVIDYSLPSSEKRLWVFDLANNVLLFHTHTSHGIKSGSWMSSYFSNKNNSKATSIGIYSTEVAYRGRHGLSLKLHGLDRYFNNNAYNRFIVMHGSWYVNKRFIEKYGRPGRSWGCPTLPTNLAKPIINTIKDKSLFVAYYPNDGWFSTSKFLTCESLANNPRKNIKLTMSRKEKESRGTILYADMNNNNSREEIEPVIAISADSYQQFFNTKPPLKRMLRRQIFNTEYIVLNNDELKQIAISNRPHNNDKHNLLKTINFIIPVVKLQRGYYATEMKIIRTTKLKDIKLNATKSGNDKQSIYQTLYFKNKPAIKIRATGRFIRWLGL